MKRILIFSLTYHPLVGGAEVAIKEITDRLPAEEFHFEMITLRFDSNVPRTEKMGKILVHRIGFTSPDARVSDRSMPLRCKVAKAFFPLAAFVKALSLERPDIIWAMMAGHAGFAALFYKLSHPKIPYFLELQDGRPFGQMKDRRPMLRFLWPLYRQIYMRADMIKCISLFIAAEVRKIGYRGRVRVIPNGADVQKFSAPVTVDQLDQLKTKFGKQAGDIFLFTASRLVLSRGVEDVIQSLAYLPKNVKFLIAGEGEDREKLERIARGLQVSDRVIFAGYVSHDDLPALLKISDIFVRPSIIEGMGNAFIEAFAAGIPIIGTPVGGIPDFLFDPKGAAAQQIGSPAGGPTGLFCGVHDPKSIAEAVQEYLDNPALKAQVVANAKKLVTEKYDWRFIARDVREKIFNQL